ncbi:MAG TPA: PfkB family carbohydrate kinase [Bryobacteraceae bacterium]
MNVEGLLAEFPKLRALVVGDVCLDRWCRYDPALAEPSKETTIPRIGVTATETTPGAGGTVANNLAALGCGRVDVLGVIGEDGHGYELARALAARGIGSDLLVRAAGVCTFTYTKVINCRTDEEDLPRVDFVNTQPLPVTIERELVGRLMEAAPQYDVVLVSDQAETDHGGVVTAAMRDGLSQLGGLVWVDSRMRAELFRRVIVKPNFEEAGAASRRALGSLDLPALRRHIEAPLLVVTRGSEGADVIDERGAVRVEGRRVEQPVDICGAGDSFSAGAALALKAGGDPVAAARFGNLVASITIMKRGTGTASPAEVLSALPASN